MFVSSKKIGGVGAAAKQRSPFSWFRVGLLTMIIVGAASFASMISSSSFFPSASISPPKIKNYDAALSSFLTADDTPTTNLVDTVKAVDSQKEHIDSVPSVIGEPGNVGKWINDYNVVHVIHTRFMQDQPDLIHLGKARMDLFQTFTLPSIRQQSNRQFLWLIWTDPNLDHSLRSELMASVEGMENTVVVGASPPVKHTNMRDGYGHSFSSLSFTSNSVWKNAQLLADYYKASQNHILLETQLDADDALIDTFAETIQAQAAKTVGRHESDFLHESLQIICPAKHLEWRYFVGKGEQDSILAQTHMDESSPFLFSRNSKNRRDTNEANAGLDGYWVEYDNNDFCINSGMTYIFHLRADMRRLHLNHQCNYDELPPCVDPVIPPANNIFHRQVHHPQERSTRGFGGVRGIRSLNSDGNESESSKSAAKSRKEDDGSKADSSDDSSSSKSKSNSSTKSASKSQAEDSNSKSDSSNNSSSSSKSKSKSSSKSSKDDDIACDAAERIILEEAPHIHLNDLVLHTNSKYPEPHYRHTCPVKSTLCRAERVDGTGLEKTMFDPDWYPSSSLSQGNHLQILCYPEGCSGTVLAFDLEVGAVNTDGDVKQVHMEIVGWTGDDAWKMTKAYVKGIGTTGLEYCWDSDLSNDHELCGKNPRGGVFYGNFHTGLSGEGIDHVDICVEPTQSTKTQQHICRQHLHYESNTSRHLMQRVSSDVPSDVSSDETNHASVILARTPTAAGFKHVIPKDASHESDAKSKSLATYNENQKYAWAFVASAFAVEQKNVSCLRSRMQHNMELILVDAIKGQCSRGHSCKQSTKEALGMLLNHTYHLKEQNRKR